MDVSESLYAHLRAIAGSHFRAQRANHTLQPTALVNEAFIKLASSDAEAFTDRTHFVSVAARAMRQVLVDHARSKATDKRGAGAQPVTLSGLGTDESGRVIDIIALDAALVRLHSLSPRQAQVVELRYFGGLTMPEVADAVGASVATVERDWKQARAWLLVHLEDRGAE